MLEKGIEQSCALNGAGGGEPLSDGGVHAAAGGILGHSAAWGEGAHLEVVPGTVGVGPDRGNTVTADAERGDDLLQVCVVEHAAAVQPGVSRAEGGVSGKRQLTLGREDP